MQLTLSNYLLSFSEKALSGTLDFPIDKEIQIIELKVLQRIQKKYCIGKVEIMSGIGKGRVTFSMPIKPRILSEPLKALLAAKSRKIQELTGEETSLYELQVQYMQEKQVHVCLFPLTDYC